MAKAQEDPLRAPGDSEETSLRWEMNDAQGDRESWREPKREEEEEKGRTRRGGGNSPHPCCATKGGALRNSLSAFLST